VNLVGNAVATIVVSKWEGAVDLKLLREQVGVGRGAAAALDLDRRDTAAVDD
jgi:Na+/H+-dicarboxylate symporter